MIFVTKAERGIIVLEMMVALLIIAMMLTVLLGLRNRDIELVSYARAITTATLLAHAKLVEANTVQDVPSIGEQGGDFSIAPPGITALQDGTDHLSAFRWTRRVLPTSFDSLREIRVRISWFRGTGEETVEMSSYVFLTPKRTS